MIPRLQARGKSFKGSCTYVLHDPKAKSRDRVAWVLTQNLHSDPDHAWFEMYETCRNQAQLKANAGLSARGRKNDKPVLHYTLAWHADDMPTPEQMRAAAFASLKVLGLAEHEAVIVAHDDKKHPHVHIVANTIHPYTGRTAELKFSKERLSNWAETYEREHGQIRCEERVKNNEKRRDVRESREREALAQLTAAQHLAPVKGPYVPIKDRSPARPQWFAKQDVINRMKRLRAELDLRNKVERGVTWESQLRARQALDRDTADAENNARNYVKERYRPHWREMYAGQAREQRFVVRSALRPLERAAFIFRNRHRLGRSQALGWRVSMALFFSTKRLAGTLEAVHTNERRALAREQKFELRARTGRIWAAHRQRFHALRDQQTTERETQRAAQRGARQDISFAQAKAHLIKDLERPPTARYVHKPVRDKAEPTVEFNNAAVAVAPTSLPRADQIRREMAAWRQNNRDLDFGREL